MSDGTGGGPLHRDVFALPFLFSVLRAFLGVDVFFFCFRREMPGFGKDPSIIYRRDCSTLYPPLTDVGEFGSFRVVT